MVLNVVWVTTRLPNHHVAAAAAVAVRLRFCPNVWANEQRMEIAWLDQAKPMGLERHVWHKSKRNAI